MPRKLSILITNAELKCRAGTELVVRDLSLGLLNEGHHPMVYSPHLGNVADEIAASGIPVVDNLDQLPRDPDIIHGHHNVETVEALLHFPKASGIYVCHDRTSWHDVIPMFPRIFRYVAVDLNCRERLLESQVPAEKIGLIHNWVDMERFHLRALLPSSPRRALVFSNYAGIGSHLEPIREACRDQNIPLDTIGMACGTAVESPEKFLGDYDLVFAKARCALEAMATGAAVVLCDTRGLGPMVTTSGVEKLRPWNFGMRCMTMPLDPALIIQEIKKYNPSDAMAVSGYIRQHADFSGAIDKYVRLYSEVTEQHRSRPEPAVDEFRDYLQLTMQRLGELELETSLYRQPFRMPAISRSAIAGLHIRIMAAPKKVNSGQMFSVQVELENHTAMTLGTFPPLPINFAYHWMSPVSRRAVVYDGMRTPIPHPLYAGEKGIYFVVVSAPERRGTFRLRITLKQEGFRWLDRWYPRVCADAKVVVE